MCSIIGIIKKEKDTDIIETTLQMLEVLEYRGYDSAGIALLGKPFSVFKTRNQNGKPEGVASLRSIITQEESLPTGSACIGHTRWATHGEPSERNAHPHLSKSGRFVLVHNGIIENYVALKALLIEKGYSFVSETDTEVLVHLIEEMWQEADQKISFEDAVRVALHKIEGAFSIAVMSTEEDKIITATEGRELCIGLLPDGYAIVSDRAALIGLTKEIIPLESGKMAILTPERYEIRTLNENLPVRGIIEKLEGDLKKIQKGGFKHFMQKEIFEQPETLTDCMRGRIRPDQGVIYLGGLRDSLEKLKQAKRIIFVGCGTSWHAGLVGRYLFEEFTGIETQAEYASEFRYRDPVLDPKRDIVIAISQSGETADTLAAVELAHKRGITVLGICNSVGSQIAKKTDGGVFLHVGYEVSVASTKAFTGQVSVLTMMALMLGHERHYIDSDTFKKYLHELHELPALMGQHIKEFDVVCELIAEQLYKDTTNALYLGRGYAYPLALEGALKLKEISLIHAEGYPAAEMKHGPIALVDDKMPVVAIATDGPGYMKIVSNIQEVKSRKAKIIAIVTKGNHEAKNFADHIIEVPRVSDQLSPLLTVIPLQLLAYHIADKRGLELDKPANLAKSVTVE